jgi:tRNA-dihydrouridine synthase
MLSARHILHEDLLRSPSLRRSPAEKIVIYQLMIRDTDRLDRIIGRLSEIRPDGVDINLACDAPNIRHLGAGSRLYDDGPRLAAVLETVRRCWPGPLTVKVRLGRNGPDAERIFLDRLRLFESSGVDGLILHPRFFEDRLRRNVRHERLAWVASLTRLPLIASGDITGPQTLRRNPALFKPACGVMVGRMAVAQPWVFAAWNGPVAVDHGDVWRRLFEYTCEVYPSARALGRIKNFTGYYARNFRFGHNFHMAVQSAPTLEAVRERAEAFLGSNPETDPEPSMMGL